jgi:hypothetical protein
MKAPLDATEISSMWKDADHTKTKHAKREEKRGPS